MTPRAELVLKAAATVLLLSGSPMSGQSVAMGGVELGKGLARAEAFRALTAVGMQLLPNRDSTSVIVSLPSRMQGLLWFDDAGRLKGAQKSFNENDVPVGERVARRMEAWHEFESLHASESCVTAMRASTPLQGVTTNTLRVSCGAYRFDYTTMASAAREAVYYSIAFNPPPVQQNQRE